MTDIPLEDRAAMLSQSSPHRGGECLCRSWPAAIKEGND
jgi:hypothetical protein